MNVSVASGFSYSDSPKNGLTVTVTTRGDKAAAEALSREICRQAWAMRVRFKVTMTSLADATTLALRTGRDLSRASICLADVADNPGGGGGGNTTALLRALVEAGAAGVLLGVFTDPALAQEAHALGEGARLRARFNRVPGPYAEPFAADATVVKLTDGRLVSTRGVLKGMALDMGASCALDLGGVTVVVISNRMQVLDPLQFESLGLDIGAARVVAVKSRGHFRSGFRDLFGPERIYEVDCPGLTSPNLAQFAWRGLKRPVYPLDEDTTWPDGERAYDRDG
jgi:microcystin degradation protein MlrC